MQSRSKNLTLYLHVIMNEWSVFLLRAHYFKTVTQSTKWVSFPLHTPYYLSLSLILILYWHLCSFAIVYTKSIKLLYEPCNVTRIMHFPCSDAIEMMNFHHYSLSMRFHSCLHSFRIENKCHLTVRLGAIQLIFHRKKYGSK